MGQTERERVAAQDERLKKRTIGKDAVNNLLLEYLPKRTPKRVKDRLFLAIHGIVFGIAEAEIEAYRWRLREMTEDVQAAQQLAAVAWEKAVSPAIERAVEKAIAKYIRANENSETMKLAFASAKRVKRVK